MRNASFARATVDVSLSAFDVNANSSNALRRSFSGSSTRATAEVDDGVDADDDVRDYCMRTTSMSARQRVTRHRAGAEYSSRAGYMY